MTAAPGRTQLFSQRNPTRPRVDRAAEIVAGVEQDTTMREERDNVVRDDVSLEQVVRPPSWRSLCQPRLPRRTPLVEFQVDGTCPNGRPATSPDWETLAALNDLIR